MLDMTVQDVLLTPFGAFFEVQVPFILGHVEKGEKSKRFSYPDYFTYPDSQHWRLGQRCPDNRGCTVYNKIPLILCVGCRGGCRAIKRGGNLCKTHADHAHLQRCNEAF